jgi:hypothetical protein
LNQLKKPAFVRALSGDLSAGCEICQVLPHGGDIRPLTLEAYLNGRPGFLGFL